MSEDVVVTMICAYVLVGASMVIQSKSRGLVADLTFFALWPFFLWRHWWKGY